MLYHTEPTFFGYGSKYYKRAHIPCALTERYSIYDDFGRIQQVVESDGTTTRYNYDANGNITHRPRRRLGWAPAGADASVKPFPLCRN
jgi:YD repeat-containing protein